MYIDAFENIFELIMGKQFRGGKIAELLLMSAVIFFCVAFGNALAQKQPNNNLNEYGLKIITSKADYLDCLAIDTIKKIVVVADFVMPLQTSWSYATTANFTHQILYKKPVAYLRLPAALALQKVADTLKKMNIGIKLFDAYRPYSVTKKMWQIVPDENYAANPAKGSGHNRGVAVDLTLVDLKTGKELPMPTPFDNFSDTAHHDFMQLDNAVIQNRNLLKSMMERYGFMALPTEWWHYSLPNPKEYDILDLDFREMKQLIK